MKLNQICYFQKKIFVLSDYDKIRVYNTKPLEYEYDIVFDNGESFKWGFYGSKPIVLTFKYVDNKTEVSFFDLEKNEIIRQFVINEVILALAIIDENTCLCVNIDLSIFCFDETKNTLTLVNNSAQSREELLTFSSNIYNHLNEINKPSYTKYQIRWIDPIPNTRRFIFRAEYYSYIFDLDLGEFVDIRDYRTLYAPILLATERYLFSLENTYNVYPTHKLFGTRVTRFDMTKDSLVIFKKVAAESIFVCDNHLLIPFPKEHYWLNFELAIYDIDTLELVDSFNSDELYDVESTSYRYF